MNVLLVEPIGNGHHMSLYVRFILRKLFQEGCRVSILTTRSTVNHPSYQLANAEAYGELRHYLMAELPIKASNSSLSILYAQIKAWRSLQYSFRKIAKDVKPDIVYLPTLDWIVKAIEILGSPFGDTMFAGLYMAPTHHRKTMNIGPAGRHDWLYSKLFQRLLKNPSLHRLLVIDETFYDFCKICYPSLSTKIEYVPDFAKISGNSTRENSRKAIGISDESVAVLVYGSLSLRKGINQLLEAMIDHKVPSNIVVILAGKPDRDIYNILQTTLCQRLLESGRIIMRLYFHDENQEYNVFMASDFVWLGYVSGFYGSSGVLYQAVHASLPIIGMKDGLIGKMIERYSLGITINPSDIDSVVRGLINASTYRQRNPASQDDQKRLAAKHSYHEYCERVFASLKV